MLGRGTARRAAIPGSPRALGLWLVCGSLLGLALFRYGLPLDVTTTLGLGLGLCTLGLVHLGVSARGRWALAAIPLLFHLQLHVPVESDWLQDVRRGRVGVRVTPGFRFGRDGPNTALLQEYVGPLPAEWRHRCVRSMLLCDWRDGNERVNSRSLIHRDDLAAVLAMLPDRDARKQVVGCLTDSGNLLRVHQGLLLTCLKVLGHPAGHDARSWWRAHAWVFVREADPERAAGWVQGWTDRARRFGRAWIQDTYYEQYGQIGDQIRATQYQEWGAWGGDRVFAEAFNGRPLKRLQGLAVEWPPGSVLWWPDYRMPDE